jgi:phosphoribosylcarboxyaminoimidazole (NCAIR) mutase
MEEKDVTLILGSPSDAENGNVILRIWKSLGLTYVVACASCHRHNGPMGFHEFVDSIKTKIIAMHGGMTYAAAGDVISLLRNLGRLDTMIITIPADVEARSAIEVLPTGTAGLTPGLNTIRPKSSLENGALVIAQLAGIIYRKPQILEKLAEWYALQLKDKPLVPDVPLVNGLIPIEEKK